MPEVECGWLSRIEDRDFGALHAKKFDFSFIKA